MRVALLSGGRSSEHDVSLASAASVRAGLREAGHDVIDVLLERAGAWTLGGGPLPLHPGGGLAGADVAFPVLHGPFGEDGTVQGLLELLDVPYVGAGVLASSLCMDKLTFKDVLRAAAVPQVDYARIRHHEWQADRAAVLASLEGLGLPVWVKPARLGSSVGIRPAYAAQELPDAIEHALEHDPLVIVEAHVDALEIECSVVGLDAPDASVPGQIVLNGGSGWYDYEAKYTPGGMELRVPAEISAATAERVRALACETFVRVGCAGFARCDFFVDGETVLVNELNTLPGFTATSVFPKLWEAGGVSFPQLVDRLLETALERWRRERQGFAY